MTTVMMLHRQTMSMPRIPRERRLNATGAMIFIDTGFLVVRPVIVTLAILAAAHCAVPPHGDTTHEPVVSTTSQP